MILLLTTILLLLLIVVQQNRGAHAFIGILMNTVIIIISIALIVNNISPIIVIIPALALIIYLTIFEQNGISKKTVSACISIIGVLTLMLPLLFLMAYKGEIAGYNELELLEDSSSYLETSIHTNMYMVFVVVLLFALIGAIMDTAMAIASAVNEFYEADPTQTYTMLLTHGNQVGRDIMGTTTNTLFFAAFGESLMLCLLFLTNGYTFEHLINSEAFLSEFGLILISNIGCVLIIPITSYITSHLLTEIYSHHIFSLISCKLIAIIDHINHETNT